MMSATCGVHPAANTQALDTTACDQAMLGPSAHRVVVSFPPLDGRSVSATHRWYVASVRPRFEDKAEERIQALGFGTFVPLVQEPYIKRRYRWGRWYDEKRTRTVKAFPSYVFVCFDVTTPSWRLIPHGDEARRCGIRKFFGPSPEQPMPVPSGTMDRLLAEGMDRPMTREQARSLIEVGVAYRIVDGPFAGHVGQCDAVYGETLHLGLTMFSRPTPVRLTVGQVEKVEA